jgi:hypothetical protein
MQSSTALADSCAVTPQQAAWSKHHHMHTHDSSRSSGK